ncbi:hypothetical protein FACS1894208_06400 [Clostridia bacterium]|nr:hypothetical protein FACS1894208_06400 [Clostridia bacterium]
MFDEYPDMLTVKEVAQYLRIGTNKAYALIASNVIPCLKLGKKILVPKQKFVEVLEEMCYNKSVQ